EEAVDECNVFVKFLPCTYNEYDLYTLFRSCGTILKVKVMINTKTDKSLGYGFVRFASPDQAKDAVSKMNRVQVGHKTLLCKLSKPLQLPSPNIFYGLGGANGANGATGNGPNSSEIKDDAPPTCDLYLRILSPTITDAKLKAFFDPYGHVMDCYVHTTNFGKSKRTGYVRFATTDEATAALCGTRGTLLLGETPLLDTHLFNQSVNYQSRAQLHKDNNNSSSTTTTSTSTSTSNTTTSTNVSPVVSSQVPFHQKQQQHKQQIQQLQLQQQQQQQQQQHSNNAINANTNNNNNNYYITQQQLSPKQKQQQQQQQQHLDSIYQCPSTSPPLHSVYHRPPKTPSPPPVPNHYQSYQHTPTSQHVIYVYPQAPPHHPHPHPHPHPLQHQRQQLQQRPHSLPPPPPPPFYIPIDYEPSKPTLSSSTSSLSECDGVSGGNNHNLIVRTQYDIDFSELYKAFSKYGRLQGLKINDRSANGTVCSTVSFVSSDDCHHAKFYLDGAELGSQTIKVDYEHRHVLSTSSVGF
ncbi:hypothetical protein SAMD00019534_030930, partial [Acytostelium subglobosum LB1]|uniref:hypothetical protein n=1 Tax=Acytostelium subglobosum LB1 TaxID=1410327 RepID=UPI000644B86E